MSGDGALWVCAVLTAGGVWLAWPRRPPEPRGVTSQRPAGRRQVSPRRVLLSVGIALAVLVMVPGPAGVGCSLLAAWLGWHRLSGLVSPAERARRHRLEAELPVAVDLLAGAVRAGADPGSALRMVAEAVPGPVADELDAVLGRLEMGGDPTTVWRALADHPGLGPLGRAMARAHRSGSSVVAAADRLALELRDAAGLAAQARARAVSTRAAAPLGLCFLPAFVLLGIVPLIAGLIGPIRWS